MEYNNDDVLRKDRVMGEEQAYALLRNGEYGVMSMCDETGGAYGVPLSYVWDGDTSLYIHCAREGRKLRNIGINPQVSFCIVGKTRVLPSRFSTERESIMLRGTVHIGLDDEEKMRALMLIVGKYSPEYIERGRAYAAASLGRVEIIKMDIETFSGKKK